MSDTQKHTKPNVPNLRFPGFEGEWKESCIGAEFELYSGNTPSRLDKNNFTGDVCWVTSGELKEHYIEDTKEKISQKAAHENNLRLLPTGTFVIAIYGLEAEGVRGTGSIITHEATISQACMAFSSKGNVSNEFLYSWYKKHGDIIGVTYAQGTKQQNLSYDIIERLKVHYPSKIEQHKLTAFITLIDERIAIQNKVIEDLKKLKTALCEHLYNETNPNCRIGDIVEQSSVRNRAKNALTVLSVSNRYGFIAQAEQFEERSIASEDTTNYKVVSLNDFAYNPARINVGSIARLKSYDKGIVSPMYICFRCKDGTYPEFLEHFFSTKSFSLEMEKRLEGSVRMCLSYEGLCNIQIFLPPLVQQKSISEKISALNRKVQLEENYLYALINQKQYLLSKLFI